MSRQGEVLFRTLGPRQALVAGGGFLHLQELPFDGTQPGHQPVELGEELSFVPTSDLDEIRGGSMANAMKGVRQPSVQKPHLMLQVQELLVKLGLLEHGRDLA